MPTALVYALMAALCEHAHEYTRALMWRDSLVALLCASYMRPANKKLKS